MGSLGLSKTRTIPHMRCGAGGSCEILPGSSGRAQAGHSRRLDRGSGFLTRKRSISSRRTGIEIRRPPDGSSGRLPRAHERAALEMPDLDGGSQRLLHLSAHGTKSDSLRISTGGLSIQDCGDQLPVAWSRLGVLKFRPLRATLRFPDQGGLSPKAACCLHA